MKFLLSDNAETTLALNPDQKVIPKELLSKILLIDELIEHAKQKAEAIVESAKEKAKEIHADAFEEGKKAGLDSVASLISELQRQQVKLRLDIQKVALPIALKAAKKMVGKELELYPERIIDIVVEAIRPVAQCKRIRIFVSKADLPLMEKAKPKLLELVNGSELFQLEAKSDLEHGSAIIESENGMINATQEHLWMLLESLFESFKNTGN